MKVGKYEFALKGIKHFAAGSDETECFVATLYVNGKRLAECENEGHGGPTNIQFFSETRKFWEEIEAFLKTQPKIRLEGSDVELDLNLDYIVDDLLQKHLQARFFKKLQKSTANYLVFKVSEFSYLHIGWEKKTIAEMLQTPHGRETIQKAIVEGIAKGYTLFNENIPAELLPTKK